MSTRQVTVMTEGSIHRSMIAFAIPIFIGNLFQQLYNTADSLIVGNFSTREALAAVSSSGTLIFLLTGFFVGVASGAGVLVSRYYGAKDFDSMKRAIYTYLAASIAAGIFLMGLCVLMTPQILRWIDTPKNVMPSSVTYFRIYSFGMVGVTVYNACTGILQAVGDSRRPLYYLIFSSALNVALDLLFVAVLGYGVGAAALATIISQLLSAFLCLMRLRRYQPIGGLSLKKIGFDRKMLGQILRLGLPSGMQNSIIGFANIIVQRNINAFGSDAMAACGSYSKVEGFAFLPILSFNMALTTFVGQNLGAKQHDRAKQGARFGILCSISIAELIGATIYIFAPHLIAAFNDDPAIVAIGTKQCHVETLFYFALAFAHSIAAILRGAGRAIVPMLTMLVFWCVVRVTYITVAIRLLPEITLVFWAYPLTWCLSCVVFLLYYLKADWVHSFDRIKD